MPDLYPVRSDDGAGRAPAKSKRRAHAVSDGRLAALEVLLLLEQGIQVQAALDTYLRNARLNPMDKGLCTELVYGSLRAEIRLQWLLRKLLPTPEKLPRPMALALSLALYALLFLQRIPPHATVDWTVGHIHQRFGKSLAGVANGALRTFLRWGDSPKQAEFYAPGHGAGMSSCKDAAKALAPAGPAPSARQAKMALQQDSLFFSMPFWVARLWEKAYGPEACRQLMARSFAAPHACLRINAMAQDASPLREALLSAGGEAVGPWGFAFAPGQSPRSMCNAPLSYWQQQGALSFQSAGSQWALQAMEPASWPGPLWDMCAGQGGKSCALVEQGIAVHLATDSHLPRLESFTGNIRRLGLTPCGPPTPPSECPSAMPASTLSPPILSQAVEGPSLFAASAPQQPVGDSSDLSPDLSEGPSHGLPLGLPDGLPEDLSDAQPGSLSDGLLGALSLEDEDYECAHAAPAPTQSVKICSLPEALALALHRSAASSAQPIGPAAQPCGPAAKFCGPAAEPIGPAALSCGPAAESSEYAAMSCDPSVLCKGSAAIPRGSSGECKGFAPCLALCDARDLGDIRWPGTILLDAPCSGLGVLHRRPDIRRSRTAASVEDLLALQESLIESAWKALLPGGLLVYMTCTLNPAENEGQMAALVRRHPEAHILRHWQSPHAHPWLEGMYAASCQKG